ncbi:MAG: aminoacyl-histidine dipeptidase [Clostridia bacterium]|nr:aminoacyl-histidine dipeptidase [Clostridia bacterium]
MNNYKKGSAEAVLAHFRQLCNIPHGSGNTKAISDYCVQFAQERGLRVIQEPCNNVIVFKKATPGYEDHPAVILQGHLDMVCEKDPDCALDMATEGIRLVEEGDWMSADGTTLGGDDGIAVACALALLDCDTLKHPPLEIVLTVDEETGMDGAVALDPSPLTARVLLNMDTEDEGVFTAGCAGGCTAQLRWDGNKTAADGEAWAIKVDGASGGHSGGDINKGKANADILLANVLKRLGALRLVRINGGSKGNAIPRLAEAVVVPENGAAVADIVAAAHAEYTAAYAVAEPELVITARTVANDAPAFSTERSAEIVDQLATQPNGVQQMSEVIPNLVQTSLNLGILTTDDSGVSAVVSLRSNVGAEKAKLKDRLADITRAHGGSIEFVSEYPAWEYRPESRVRDLLVQCYEEQTGKKPKVEVIHAGLECGLLGEKLPGLDAVSFGPEMHDIHTSRERMSKSSAARTWDLLLRVLEKL